MDDKPTMNIRSGPGVKVRFAYPENGYDHDRQESKAHLVEGNIYTVERTSIGSFHTDVLLKEFPTVWFNSVHFAPCE